MNLPPLLAKHLRETFFGGNWTDSHLEQAIAGVSWQEATTSIYGLNTIAALVYHINYYVEAILKVMTGNALDSSDKLSFDLPPVDSEEHWKELIERTRQAVQKLCGLIEQLPEQQLWETFTDPKYRTYYRNLQGLIEHSHYHLGQIVVLKKILQHPEMK
ncbi:MAG TPA: DinB family protein [Flavisolibacter sp.]|nr:DinB family protein [Flavisolibacter sp.]